MQIRVQFSNADRADWNMIFQIDAVYECLVFRILE